MPYCGPGHLYRPIQARYVLLELFRHAESSSPPGLIHRSRAAIRHYFFVGTGLGALTLGLAITVSFLAVSNTTEARAPSLDDVTRVPEAILVTPTVTPTPDYGPSTIYLESPLILRKVDAPPKQGETVPDILRKADNRIAPPPPQAPLGSPVVSQKGPIEGVNITFYDCANQGFCGNMYGGEQVYEGAAACSWNLPLDTAFYIVGDPTQRIYVCKDRGLLQDTWVDIFWYHPEDGYNWQSSVGRIGTINIVYLPK